MKYRSPTDQGIEPLLVSRFERFLSGNVPTNPYCDVDAAEKLVTLVRSATGEQGQLRIIVPDYAKSAGTLMALGADSIVMSDSSELGPIDPQVSLKDGNGNDVIHSVLTYLNAYDEAKQAFRDAPQDPANRITFERFDPMLLSLMSSLVTQHTEGGDGRTLGEQDVAFHVPTVGHGRAGIGCYGVRKPRIY